LQAQNKDAGIEKLDLSKLAKTLVKNEAPRFVGELELVHRKPVT